MCSIPGLPTPGSKVPVLITRVNLNSTCGLVELWINMDNGSKRAYDQMRDEIQTPKRKFYGPEGNPGDHCLVCISDTWHRARIVSIQTEACKVFLIDQGQPHFTTNEALAWGNNDSFLLPPETESCILANVLSLGNNWPEKATTFLESLPGKNFKGLVQHVLMPHRTILLDIPTISKHMCKIGVAKKMPVDEFKCLVQKCLEADHVTQQQNLNVGCQLQKNDLYFYPELLTDTFETVNVTAVADPHHIFCKLQIFSKSVKILSEQIQQHYEESSDSGETQLLTCGEPCAARGITGKWHRSLLKQTMTTDDAVEVFYVDEGKSELVPIGNIRPLHVKFLKMPVVTYPCSLEGLKDNGTGWTTAQTDYLKLLLLNQTFVAKFYHNSIRQDVYNVILYAHNAACINRCFMEMAGPSSPSKTEQESYVQNVPIPSIVLSSLGDKHGMELHDKFVVNVDGLLEETLPWSKYCAVNGRTDDGSTSGAGDTLIKRSSEHPSPLIQRNGNPLTSSPSEVQTSSGDKRMENGYPLNGHPHCTDHPLGLNGMKQEMTSLLQTAHQISNSSEHAGVPNEDGLMQKLINGSVLTKTTNQKQIHSSNGTCARDELKSQSMFNTEDHSDIAVPQYAIEIECEGMANADAVAMQKYWKPVAKECVGIEHPQTETFLQDGQSESNMTRLSVSKENVNTTNVPAPEIEHEKNLEEGRKTNVDVILDKEIKSGQIDLEITQPSLPFCPEGNFNICMWPNISQNKTRAVYTSCIVGPHYFWCQYTNTEDLNIVSRLAQEAGQAHQDMTFLETLGRGSPCLAVFSSDKEWYRAQVVRRVDDKFNVVFIDYGNEFDVDIKNVRPVPQSLLEKAPQAFLCSLDGFDKSKGSWDDEGYDEFYNLVVDKELRVTVFNTEDHPEISVPRYTVELECEGVVVNTLMEKYWKPVAKECVLIEHPQTETFLQDGQSESNMTHLSVCEGNVKNCMYKKPIISKNKKEAVYASCIGDPNFFWCQYANTEELSEVSRLAQEMVHTQQDTMFPETLGPGSPCLALFSSDKQWYRAQVISRVEDAFNIVFIDYGNECDVNIKNVRPLPQSLLEKAPQAFLCSLNGFNKSKGSWDDEGYDEFYNLVVDKELRVTVFNTEDHPEISVPQYTVELECEGVVVNTLMEKYWKPVAKECVSIEHPQTETFLVNDDFDGQSESNMTHLRVYKGNVNTCMYKKPCISKHKKEEVYASCIGGPNFFWCQYTNTEELSEVSRLAQEAAHAHQDTTFLETLGPGSPCLALFSSDKQWYRAQVISRVDNEFNVVFIDYGNECDIDIKNVRSLPQYLLEKAPQAFLCSLNGFDESKGSWDDEGYDEFYNLLVDKQLRVAVIHTQDHSEIAVPQYAVEIECEGKAVNVAMQKYWKPVAKERVGMEHPQTETFVQDGQTETNMTHLSVSKGNVKNCTYKRPCISKNKKEEVYASCIGGPNFFWCQYTNTEELSEVSRLAQEAAHAHQDTSFLETLGPGSPCLALFSSDKQWYRAQVISRVDNEFNVVFIDYGNECDIDIKNVRSLPQSLLEKAPQAFLCSLNGFDESKGSWDDEGYDEFYNLLVDKQLRVAVIHTENHSEIAVPQYAVEIECEGKAVNVAMQKYWKPVTKERVGMKHPQTETFLQDGQTETNMTHLSVSKGNVKNCTYKRPCISKNKKEEVYASCIGGPNFFWCQYTNTEELSEVSRLAQEAAHAQQDVTFPETLGPGSPCLALFSSDKQWYRAQVISRVDDEFNVVFIDYGNECDIHIKNVRSLPQSLLEKAPQAFLCSLNGFDESKGSWDDEGYDEFYNLVVNKELRVTVFNTEDHPEFAVPQYAVEIECEGVAVNSLMEKYWKGQATDHALAKSL